MRRRRKEGRRWVGNIDSVHVALLPTPAGGLAHSFASYAWRFLGWIQEGSMDLVKSSLFFRLTLVLSTTYTENPEISVSDVPDFKIFGRNMPDPLGYWRSQNRTPVTKSWIRPSWHTYWKHFTVACDTLNIRKRGHRNDAVGCFWSCHTETTGLKCTDFLQVPHFWPLSGLLTSEPFGKERSQIESNVLKVSLAPVGRSSSQVECCDSDLFVSPSMCRTPLCLAVVTSAEGHPLVPEALANSTLAGWLRSG